MNLSLGELEALCLKAARGAGHSWGMAQEAGRAVRWLEARGLEGAMALADLLETTDGAIGGKNCALTQGARLSDQQPVAHQEIDVVSPLLLRPFLAGHAELKKVGSVMQVHPASPPDLPSVQSRAEIGADLYARLNRFAQRTYAPATEASRLAGAGTGGLTDND